MKLRDKYILYNCEEKTYIKGWLHLISSTLILLYLKNNINKSYLIIFFLTLFISGIYHLISFDNKNYDIFISLLDYIFVFITVYVILRYNKLNKKYMIIDELLLYILIIMIIVLTIIYLQIEIDHVEVFHNIYILYALMMIIVMLPNIIDDKRYIYNIIIPLLIIHIIKIIPIDLSYKKICDNHDIFQIMTIVYCYYFIQYLS